MIKYLVGVSCVVLLGACEGKVKAPATPDVPKQKMQAHGDAPQAVKPPRATLDDMDDSFDIKNFSKANAKFVGLVDGEEMESAELRIRAYFTPEESSEGKLSYSYEKTYESNGLTRVVATVTGLMDDSVQAEQLIAYFKPISPVRAVLADYGMRFQCYRGDNTEQWTVKLCP